MPIKTLITEAKKIIPIKYEVAHAWLDDLLITSQCMHDPINAIRFFMLGLHSGRVITLDACDDFDLLIASKRAASIH